MAFAYTRLRKTVQGSQRVLYYTGCSGANADTLTVGLARVDKVTIDSPTTSANITATVTTPTVGQSLITFGAGAGFSDINLTVAGT